ncbi:Uncharacterised protein [BD1-7 clade bacterium]|uniref:Energy transducer TonB n=1 Tax=BD1-7 clade bacterium TaxID=2029982 RepID=A0A5S9QBU9_9GAMM|nr:Uncharacterised protein [BD1-7 clade bacterium]CAA0118906.1 Uncharacterised protein [BD1-7 clade bacterium]
MQEWQRAECLEAMGLRVFQPRFELLGAKPSTVLDEDEFGATSVPEAATGRVESSLSSEGQGSPKAASDILRGIAQDADAPKPNSRPKLSTSSIGQSVLADAGIVSVPSDGVGGQDASLSSIKRTLNQQSKQAQASVLRYRLRIVAIGDLMMVLEQPTLEWLDESTALSFFADLHFALLRRMPEREQIVQAQFNWPPSRHLGVLDSPDAAREMLGGFIAEHANQRQVSAFMLWGKPVSDYLFDSPMVIDQHATYLNTPVVQLASLQDYWADPLQKRQLWQAIKPLVTSSSRTSASSD